MSGAIYADDTIDIENVQLVTSPFIVGLNVTVLDVQSVASQAGAQGNTLSVDAILGNVNVSNTQTVEASGVAESIVNLNSASYGATSVAYALGNSATITTCCDNIIANSTQIVGSGHEIAAASTLTVENWAMNPSTSALATANAISTQTWYGTALNTNITQQNQANVISDAHIGGGGLLADSASVVSTAIANTGFAGGEQTTVIANVDQDSHGQFVQATGSISSPSVEDTWIATTATGNNFGIENSYGFVSSNVDQHNSADVRAQTDVNVGTWENYNSATSYAVGNSNLTSNIGSDIYINNLQLNEGGGIEATTNFDGTSAGGVGYDTQVVSAAAFGNAVSGYVCSDCGGGITANNNQTNSAQISANASITSGDNGTIIGSATAIGNTATFHTVTGQ